jgi:4'-phosphopantetheinyl transferase
MPLIYNQRTASGAVVGVWQIAESAAELMQLLPLDSDQLSLLNSFTRETRKCEWLASRLVLMSIIGQNVKLGYRHNGAPFLEDFDGFISLSHTKGYAAAIYHPSQPVGIDIEYPSDRVLKVTDRFLSAEEQAFIPFSEATIYQTVCWCAKEAMYKWWGRSNVTFNTDIRVHPFAIVDELFAVRAQVKDASWCDLSLKALVNPGFVLVFNDSIEDYVP